MLVTEQPSPLQDGLVTRVAHFGAREHSAAGECKSGLCSHQDGPRRVGLPAGRVSDGHYVLQGGSLMFELVTYRGWWHCYCLSRFPHSPDVARD